MDNMHSFSNEVTNSPSRTLTGNMLIFFWPVADTRRYRQVFVSIAAAVVVVAECQAFGDKKATLLFQWPATFSDTDTYTDITTRLH